MEALFDGLLIACILRKIKSFVGYFTVYHRKALHDLYVFLEVRFAHVRESMIVLESRFHAVDPYIRVLDSSLSLS